MMINKHSFHIPVMGIGFTLDTPLKVSPYGMDSVMSIGDDILMEKLRKMYCEKYRLVYEEISDKLEDFRARRITSYLNVIKTLAEQKFDSIVNSTLETGAELTKYFGMLPNGATLFAEFKNFIGESFDSSKAQTWLKEHLTMGSIDVNIMTKLDKPNYKDKEKLPVEFNDAHAALRGYAKSELNSSIIFSAGMNPKLFSYIETFEDFYPKENLPPKKKIVLKVSDYRSALIQGKFLAKKGLWVSEYRIESGLNCGGHAFATEGMLMGPILNEFKEKRDELISSVHTIMVQALQRKGIEVPTNFLPLKISAQGGVGTSEEHNFLLQHYSLDSIGWGTPFLLVPEVTNVDETTLRKLAEAKEKDLYLSDISPLGVRFNNLRGNTKDFEKSIWIDKGRPGSACPKKYLASNTEFTNKPICTASRQYQHLKLQELDELNLSKVAFKERVAKIEEKSCICVGLGTSALLVNNLDFKVEGNGVSICPGPNLAYFSKVMKLTAMVDHIYGRTDSTRTIRASRPHMFIKELDMYLNFLKEKIESLVEPVSEKIKKYYIQFASNLNEGINYYYQLATTSEMPFGKSTDVFLRRLSKRRITLSWLNSIVEELR